MPPQAYPLDSGATAVRPGGFVAQLCSIDPSGAPEPQLGVGGAIVSARTALFVEDEFTDYGWTAPVWFCEPWIPSFGLLGLTGFFDHFEITIASYEEWLELRPIN